MQRFVLKRSPDEPVVNAGSALKRRFAEKAAVSILRAKRAVHAIVLGDICGPSCAERVRGLRLQLDHRARIGTFGMQGLGGAGASGGQHATVHRAAFAVFTHHADGGEDTAVVAIAPVEARAERAAFVSRLFGPAVMIRIVAGLIVPAAGERESRRLAALVREESHDIAAAERGLIDQHFEILHPAGAK